MRTQSDFEGFTQEPEGERLGAATSAVGPTKGPDAVHYRVVRSIEGKQSA